MSDTEIRKLYTMDYPKDKTFWFLSPSEVEEIKHRFSNWDKIDTLKPYGSNEVPAGSYPVYLKDYLF